jgi:DNA-binding NarL/FixJ family response regulator
VKEVLEAIRLLICDDHRLLTDTLTTVVAQDKNLDLLAPPVHTPEEAVDISSVEKPDVVLMDVMFQGPMSGIEATRRIKQASPATKVVVMTAAEDERLLVEAVEAGASGFLHKTEGVDELLATIKAAAAGEILIDRGALARLLPLVAREREAKRDAQQLIDQLTEREREILGLLAEGLRNDDIAARLYISPQTVQTHVRNLLGKLGVHSKLEAVAFAVRHGAVAV